MLNLIGLIELGKLAILLKTKHEHGIDEAIEYANKTLEQIQVVAFKKQIHTSQISTCQMIEEVRDSWLKIITFRDVQEA